MTTSTLKRPPAKDLARFTRAGIGRDTVGDFLRSGFSLAICCRSCPRCIEWTPPELESRFSGRLGTPITAIAGRLACVGEGGCGAADVAVFPHLYDGDWSWPRPGTG